MRFAEAYPDVVEELCGRYGEAHRAYHTWDHVQALLKHFDRLNWGDLDAVELALYWHDAVYAPLSATNEADSAALMVERMTGRSDAATLDDARAIVLATATHAVPDGASRELARDCAQFLDMDLSILGEPWEVFAAYDRAIRTEFGEIPDAVFLPRRRAVMAGFLARERLFLTDAFHTSHDAQARSNLTRLIATLPES